MMKRKMMQLAAPIALLLILQSCGTTSTGAGPRTIDTSCLVFKPITFAEEDPYGSDTAETVAQIREHNAKWEELCGGETI